MVYIEAIGIDYFEVGTAVETLKSRTLNGAF